MLKQLCLITFSSARLARSRTLLLFALLINVYFRRTEVSKQKKTMTQSPSAEVRAALFTQQLKYIFLFDVVGVRTEDGNSCFSLNLVC